MPFTVYVREHCGLCEEMLAELAPIAERRQISLQIVDLDRDGDAVRQRRYSLKVPVLEWDGALICYGRLDHGELQRLLAEPRNSGPSR
jgi:hypothetical protein